MHKIIFIFLFFSSLALAQQKELDIMAPYILGGTWTGKVTQTSGGIAIEYYYEITLSLSGNVINGKGTIKTGNSYGNFVIKGSYIGNQVNLEDVKVTAKNIRENADWCIKKMPLKFLFREGAFRLEGSWSGQSQYGACKPGRIYLKKETVRA